MKICVSIVGPDMKEALCDMKQAEDVADVIELRLDCIKDFNLEKLVKSASGPLLITNRSKKEGGSYEGTEESRIDSLRQAINLGVKYVDIEASANQPIARGMKGTRIIGSYHNFSRTPFDLDSAYRKLASVDDFDIVKIATMAERPSDSLRMLDQLSIVRLAKSKPMIGICMGEHGKITRVYGPAHGGYMTMASLDETKSAAPGQIPAATLKKVWRDLKISQF